MEPSIIEKLRQLVAPPVARETFTFGLLPEGIPIGAITEISGRGKTEFVVRFLAEHPEFTVAWLEKSFSAYPFAFLQQNIDLKKILFLEGSREIEWCIYQSLRSQSFDVVVSYCEEMSLRSLRRIQLQAEKSHSAFLWLTDGPKNSWPVYQRVAVCRENGKLVPVVLKMRGGSL